MPRPRCHPVLALAIACSAACAPALAGVPPDLTAVGAAYSPGDAYVLTRDPLPYMGGGVWRNEPVSLLQSFRVRFSWQISAGYVPLGDGLAFVIQANGPYALGLYGGGLGFMGLRGVASVVSATGGMLGLSLTSDPISAKASPVDLMDAYRSTGREVVTYDATAHKLSMSGVVRVQGVDYPVSDEKDVDLAALLGSTTATIGFTGGAGAYTSTTRIEGFHFEQ
jgi:hypothetical protein